MAKVKTRKEIESNYYGSGSLAKVDILFEVVMDIRDILLKK